MARLYISQERLDTWSAEDRVAVDGDVMKLAGDGRSFRLVPAVRFLRVSDGGPDAHGLLGKVKAIAALEADGGEQYMDSVIMGETAYDVQQGFLGLPQPPGG
jgi:hypothetical protein